MIGQKIKNLIFRARTSFDRDPGKFELSIARDWALSVAAFAALVAAAAAWNLYLYVGISRDEAFSLSTGASQAGEEITREKVEEAYDYFKGKDARFEYVRLHKSAPADPSR